MENIAVALIVANIAVVIGAYVSLKVSVAELKVKVDTLWIQFSGHSEGQN